MIDTAFLFNFINAILKEIENNDRSQTGASAGTLVKNIGKFEFYFYLTILCEFFGIVNDLSILMQKKDIDINAIMSLVDSTKKKLLEFRSDSCFESFWEEVDDFSHQYELDEPEQPRIRRVPR
jgi:hypothetical protein